MIVTKSHNFLSNIQAFLLALLASTPIASLCKSGVRQLPVMKSGELHVVRRSCAIILSQPSNTPLSLLTHTEKATFVGTLPLFNDPVPNFPSAHHFSLFHPLSPSRLRQARSHSHNDTCTSTETSMEDEWTDVETRV